jgi:hypothetical protein
MQHFTKSQMKHLFSFQSASIILSFNCCVASLMLSYRKSVENCAINVNKPPYFFWENNLPYYLEETTSKKCPLMFKKESLFNHNKETVYAISFGDSYEWVLLFCYIFTF